MTAVTAVIAVVALFVVIKYGVAVGILAGAVGWLGHSYARPWATCWLCGGKPRHGGKTFSVSCRACGATGKRRRLGSRLLRGGLGKL